MTTRCVASLLASVATMACARTPVDAAVGHQMPAATAAATTQSSTNADPGAPSADPSTPVPAEEGWHCEYKDGWACSDVPIPALCAKLDPKTIATPGRCSDAAIVVGCRLSHEFRDLGPQTWTDWYTTHRLRCNEEVPCNGGGATIVAPTFTPNQHRSCFSLPAGGSCRFVGLCNEYEPDGMIAGKRHCDTLPQATWKQEACPRANAVGVCVAPTYSWWSYRGDMVLGSVSAATDRCINGSRGFFLATPPKP